jgi:carboxymethylenebutenolidase
MGRLIDLGTEADGRPRKGYLAEAGNPSAPAVVVIQEWWGLQDQIKGVCDRYAAEGYDALAPDLYYDQTFAYHDKLGAGAAMNALDNIAATDGIVRAAALYLGAPGRKVGITGYCLGGIVAILAAIRLTEFVASVPYYGVPSDALADLGAVRIPLQGHFASGDDWCTPADVDRLERALSGSSVEHEIHRYDAPHGFSNEDTHNYRADVAEEAWRRGMRFWANHLG